MNHYAQADCRDEESNPLRSNISLLIKPIQSIAKDEMSDFEKNYLNEINLARTNPSAYASFLEERLNNFSTETTYKEDGSYYQSVEGKKAVIEAINFLRSQRPLPPLKASSGLSLAGQDLVKDHGLSGKTGHISTNGDKPVNRIERYGNWMKAFGENISYSPQSPRGHVVNLIVDDGVSSRGHRKNIFNNDFLVAGIACGDHKIYKLMCVMDFSYAYVENKPNGGAVLIGSF